MQDNSLNKMTRRDFLKFLTSGALMLGLGTAVSRFGSLPGSGVNTGLLQAAASSSGINFWSRGINLLSTPIHAAVLPNGKILYITGSGEAPTQAAGPYLAGILDPITNTQTKLTVAEDIFCGGNCLLPSGNVLFTGGTLAYGDPSTFQSYEGLSSAYEFDFTSNSFVKKNSMAHGRWYPTQVALPNGTVLIISGLDELGCTNHLVEIYDPATQSFSISYDPLSGRTYTVGYCNTGADPGSPTYGGTKKGTSPGISLYPRMHLMPNGLVANVGMSQPLKTWNPSTGHWVIGGQFAIYQNRTFGTSVLLPLQNSPTETGKILVIGGAPNRSYPATNTCEIVTPNGDSLQTQFTAPTQYPRIYLNATILPTGSIFVNGGTTQGGASSYSVYAAELFDPTSQTWSTMPSATISRRYHSVALLLPDGRVWTAGTTLGLQPPGDLTTEIFSPAYVTGTRPTISSDPIIQGGYGGSIIIPTPDAAHISAVSLVSVSSVTHHHSSEQRLIWLQIQSRASDILTVAAPINSNLAPAGYYMIHVLDDNSTPSIAKFIKIPS